MIHIFYGLGRNQINIERSHRHSRVTCSSTCLARIFGGFVFKMSTMQAIEFQHRVSITHNKVQIYTQNHEQRMNENETILTATLSRRA